jgi:hypothetical protein
MMKSNVKVETDERPIWMLSVAEFKKMLQSASDDGKGNEILQKKEKFIYGLQGICREFNVAHNTAQRLKDGILREAVLQAGPGCKIIVDRELARKLFTEHMEDKR